MSIVVVRGKVHDHGRRVDGRKIRRQVQAVFPAGSDCGAVVIRGIGGLIVEDGQTWFTDDGWGVDVYNLSGMLGDLDGLEVTVVVADEPVDLERLMFGDGYTS